MQKDQKQGEVEYFHFDRNRLIEVLKSAHEPQAALILGGITPSEWEELRPKLNDAMRAKVERAIIVEDQVSDRVTKIAEKQGILLAARGTMQVAAKWEQAIGNMQPEAFSGLSTAEFADKLLDSIKFEEMASAIKKWGDSHG